MRGVEGGIPYGVPPRPLPVHMTKSIAGHPVCGAEAWRIRTTTNPEHVTCSDCKRKDQ